MLSFGAISIYVIFSAQIGGEVSGDPFYFLLEYDEGGEQEGGGCLRRIRGEFHQPLSGYDGCHLVDGVTNYFLARTETVRRIGFDPFLKRLGHTGKSTQFFHSQSSSFVFVEFI